MVINHAHRLIFIHIPKTGGTSIMSALQKLDGGDSEAVAKTKHETFDQLIENYAIRTGRAVTEIDGYKKFCFVRNPWDRMVSLHKYLTQHLSNKFPDVPAEFNQFITAISEGAQWAENMHSLKPQTAYFDNSSFNVGRYENLASDFSKILANVHPQPTLAHLNSTTKKQHWSNYYNEDSREYVGKMFKQDIEELGYCFDRPQDSKAVA